MLLKIYYTVRFMAMKKSQRLQNLKNQREMKKINRGGNDKKNHYKYICFSIFNFKY